MIVLGSLGERIDSGEKLDTACGLSIRDCFTSSRRTLSLVLFRYQQNELVGLQHFLVICISYLPNGDTVPAKDADGHRLLLMT